MGVRGLGDTAAAVRGEMDIRNPWLFRSRHVPHSRHGVTLAESISHARVEVMNVDKKLVWCLDDRGFCRPGLVVFEVDPRQLTAVTGERERGNVGSREPVSINMLLCFNGGRRSCAVWSYALCIAHACPLNQCNSGCRKIEELSMSMGLPE